jgi:RNA polymerase sigma-70 factor (ECF subfamily)
MNAGTGTFTDALEEHWKPIFHLGLRMFGNPAEAEEAAQQTFFQAYQHWDQFEGRSEIQTWLFRIAINVCRKQLKQRNRFQGYELDPEKLTASGDLDRSADDLQELVRMAFESLDPRDRLILTLFCIEQLRHVEIAGILGVPEGTVWSRLHHAKKRLERRIEILQKGESK